MSEKLGLNAQPKNNFCRQPFELTEKYRKMQFFYIIDPLNFNNKQLRVR